MTTPGPETSNPLEGKKKRKADRKWIPKHIYRKEKRKSLKKKVNLIHNFSSIQLTESMKSVLNKDLNFCPSKKGVNYTELLADLFRLERKMAWKYHFQPSLEEEPFEKTYQSFLNLSSLVLSNLHSKFELFSLLN